VIIKFGEAALKPGVSGVIVPIIPSACEPTTAAACAPDAATKADAISAVDTTDFNLKDRFM
jgi:hypothetical protein